jgi:hypothetical protein
MNKWDHIGSGLAMRRLPEKKKIGDLWKEEPRWSSKIGQWKVQFPKGIGTFRTKREAMLWVDQMIKDGLATDEVGRSAAH